jgi:hypothetical protein
LIALGNRDHLSPLHDRQHVSDATVDPRHLFSDERLRGFCVYCGDQPSSADHVPARVFLDEPHPETARVVDACAKCNSGASLDEQFVACLIESVVCSSTDSARLEREKVRRTLSHAPLLGQMIARGRSPDLLGGLNWNITSEQYVRVERVVVKLARGLIAYEESNPQLDDPEHVSIRPLVAFGDAEREEFEGRAAKRVAHRSPEVGGRAFIRAWELSDGSPWIVVQPDRFRYRVDGTEVRMVLRGYLACIVAW